MHFTKRRRRVFQPVQHEVGPHQPKRAVSQRQLPCISLQQLRPLAAPARQPGHLPADRLQHRVSEIHRQRQRLRVALLQVTDAVAGRAANIGHARGRNLGVAQPLAQTQAGFACQHGRRVIAGRSAGEFALHGGWD